MRHEGETVREFYAALPAPVVVGIEATGSMGWFLRLMEELGVGCQVGHPAAIRKAETRRQKHDRRDAALLLQLLIEDRFPTIWMPSSDLRDVRGLLLHRHQWVRMRTRVQNALQAIALNHGMRRGARLWNHEGQAALMALRLPPHTARRRDALHAVYRRLSAQVGELDARVTEEAGRRPGATLLMTHPGVGPVTALATDVFLGEPTRFADGKALASYGGMIPMEYSSGARQRLGALSKQGNPFLRFLWGEAAMHAVRRDLTRTHQLVVGVDVGPHYHPSVQGCGEMRERCVCVNPTGRMVRALRKRRGRGEIVEILWRACRASVHAAGESPASGRVGTPE